MHVEETGVVYDASQRSAAERIAFFTSLCPLSSGTWLAGYQVGPKKNAPTSTIRLSRSRDDGRSWEMLPARFNSTYGGVPGSLGTAEIVEAAPDRLLLFTTWFDRSDPARPLFDPATEGILHSRQLFAVSTDEGETWSDWQALDVGTLTGTATTGPLVRWRDGRFAYALESFKEFDDPAPPRHGAWIISSADGGRSFSAPQLVAQDPQHQTYYWDQRLCPGRELGEFIALFWTHDRSSQKDLNVHINMGRWDGKQWIATPPRATPIHGQISAPWLLDDGRLLAFVVARSRPATMTLWVSPDGGHSWPADERLVVYSHEERAAVSKGGEQIDFAQYWEDMGKWSFGHPALRPLGADRVLLAYYAGTPDTMSIHWARVNVH